MTKPLDSSSSSSTGELGASATLSATVTVMHAILKQAGMTADELKK